MVKEIIKSVIYKIVPIKKKRIVFMSLGGHYSDSPKCISECLHELDDSYDQIWLVKSEFSDLLPEYVKYVDIDSFKASIYKGSAVAIVDNVFCGKEYTQYTNDFLSRLKVKFFSFFNFKNNQTAITTWHGTPLKRGGRDQVGNENIVDFICPNVTMVLGNQYSIDILSHQVFNKLKMELIGTPRNDALFKQEYYYKNKKALGLENKKIILFAPTFRNASNELTDICIRRSGIDQIEMIQFDLLLSGLEKKFGGEWVFICRLHYHVAAKIDWDLINSKYNGKVINGNLFDDMSTYLSCADILLSDASSCVFDFALTHRPCILFFPDYDYYNETERGFHIDILSSPFALAKNFEELMDLIELFDEEYYHRNVDRMLGQMKYVDDEYSTIRATKYLLKKISGSVEDS